MTGLVKPFLNGHTMKAMRDCRGLDYSTVSGTQRQIGDATGVLLFVGVGLPFEGLEGLECSGLVRFEFK